MDAKKLLTAMSGIALLVAFFFNWALNALEIAKIFYFIAIFTGGYYVFSETIKGLFKQRFFNIDPSHCCGNRSSLYRSIG